MTTFNFSYIKFWEDLSTFILQEFTTEILSQETCLSIQIVISKFVILVLLEQIFLLFKHNKLLLQITLQQDGIEPQKSFFRGESIQQQLMFGQLVVF